MGSTPIKPGYLTTEFWVTVFTNLFGAIIATAGLFGYNLDGSALQPLVTCAAMIAMAIATMWYSHGRASLKAAAMIATGPSTHVTNVTTPRQEPSTPARKRASGK